jgi:3-methylfumaryl-CoA hydratase
MNAQECCATERWRGIIVSGDLQAWVGRTETVTDSISVRQLRQLAATLDRPLPSGHLPPLAHWIGWQYETPMSGLGPDGHTAKGGFLPPVPLDRRMWAGGRLQFSGHLAPDEPLSRYSEIIKVTEKTGTTGQMVFVTVAHTITGAQGRIDEEQDIVYVALPSSFTPPPPQPAPPNPDWTETLQADAPCLFRFSALTFNAHRIHYDLPYAQNVEHYPGLVTHGPLQALALLTAAIHRNGQMPRAYKYRGVRPAFAGPLMLAAWGNTLATINPEGLQCMTAEVTW